jgi:predicted GNAT family acetyltransferase
MRAVRETDPVAFRAAVGEFLRRDEVRHSLMIGVLDTLIERPEVYPRFHLWAVEDDGRVVGVGIRTEPHNVLLPAPSADGAIACLVDALIEEQAEVPGVVGGLPEADEFATRYAAAAGVAVASRMDQAIHVLESVNDVPLPPGAARQATSDDLDCIVGWVHAFREEAAPGEPIGDPEQVRRRVAGRLDESTPDRYDIWEDGEPVCLVGSIAAARGTARVGPVYTPPEHRRKGYGTALTAHATRELLDSGMKSCLLYTDLANPTSNAIYARIGYRRVCDSAMIQFG